MQRFKSIWGHIQRRKYKGRRIKCCDRWKDFELFKQDMYSDYLAHVKEHGEKSTTIDRIDNRKGYSPENCRWSTYKAQNNNRTDNFLISFKGEKKTLMEWCEQLSIPYERTYRRLKLAGWTVEEALTLDSHPIGKGRRKHKCPHGHPYNEENTYWHNGKHRYCRTCLKNKVNKYRKNV